MAFYEVYIGREPEPGEAFSWDDGDWSGNQPPSIGAGRFPPTDCKQQPYDILHSRMRAGDYEWKKTDWDLLVGEGLETADTGLYCRLLPC